MYMLYGIYIYTGSKYEPIDQIDKQVISRHVVFFTSAYMPLGLYKTDTGSSRQVKINVVADGDKTPSRASILM